MPPDPLEKGALRPLNCNSRLLLFYPPPTSNFIENPGKCPQHRFSGVKQNGNMKYILQTCHLDAIFALSLCFSDREMSSFVPSVSLLRPEV